MDMECSRLTKVCLKSILPSKIYLERNRPLFLKKDAGDALLIT